MATRSKSKEKKGRSGIVFMLIICALLGIIIYAYRDNFAVLFNSGVTKGKTFIDDKLGKGKDEKEDTTVTHSNHSTSTREVAVTTTTSPQFTYSDPVENESATITHSMENENESHTETASVEDKNRLRTGYVYFSRLDEHEKLKLYRVPRTISFDDAPLTRTLEVLFEGPTGDEKTSEIITNIPQNTKLLSVYVKDRVAYINVSRDFEYNPYGREATILQLQQIIFTATEFSTVDAVKFLIGGTEKTYLGGEGIVISKPLSRNDFS